MIEKKRKGTKKKRKEKEEGFVGYPQSPFFLFF